MPLLVVAEYDPNLLGRDWLGGTVKIRLARTILSQPIRAYFINNSRQAQGCFKNERGEAIGITVSHT